MTDSASPDQPASAIVPPPSLTPPPPPGFARPHEAPAWRRLAEATPLAFKLKFLLIAALGLLALQAGWRTLDTLAPVPDHSWAAGLDWPLVPVSLRASDSLERLVLELFRNATRPFLVVTEPLIALIGLDSTIPLASALAALIWAGIVQALLGLTLAKLTSHQIARGETWSLRRAVGFALRRCHRVALAFLVPLLVLAMLGLVSAPLGLLAQLGVVGQILAALGFGLALLLAIPMTMIWLGVLLGWPLMVLTVAAEDEDHFEAISRVFSYVFQKFVPLLTLLALSFLLTFATQGLAELIALVLQRLAQWGPGWFNAATPIANSPEAVALLDLWNTTLRLAVAAVPFSAFWCLMTVIYLTLRRLVDGVPLDDLSAADGPTDSFDNSPPPPPPTPQSS